MLGHNKFRVGARVGILGRHVGFVEGVVVHVDLPGIDANPVASHPDYAFDVALRRIARIAKDHNVAALNRFQTIDKLVDEDAFLVFERRHHAGAFDLHRLVEEDDDEGRDRYAK